MPYRIKVCCIRSRDEAAVAIEAGAHGLGLVSEMPSGPGVIDDAEIRYIAAHLPPGISSFLLTRRTDADAIAEHVIDCGTGCVQIVSHIAPQEYPRLIRKLPAAVRRIQVIHVEDEAALDLIAEYEPHVHAFLLDSGRPSLPVAELGGTGRTHDWAISCRFVAATSRPVFLAGGLNADNVGKALRTVRPWGVDICTGARTGGDLDPGKVRAFIAAANAA